MTISAMDAKASRTGGDWLQTRPGERCSIRVSAADTNGAYSVVEIVSSPGDGTSMHVHRNEDEYMFVLEGTVRVALGDKRFDANAGAVIAFPRNIPHGWGNPSRSPLRILVTSTPGGIENLLPAIAASDAIALKALSETFGVQALGPMPL